MQAPMFRQSLLLCTVLAAALGCSRKAPQAERATTDNAAQTAPESSPAPHADASTAPIDTTAGNEVQLAGMLGCGHCVFHVTGECAACVKTASGDIYVIDGVQEGSDLWEKRLEEGRSITVTGAVLGAADDKLKHIAMTSFELK